MNIDKSEFIKKVLKKTSDKRMSMKQDLLNNLDYIDDEEIMLECIKKNGRYISLASDRLKDNKNFILSAIYEWSRAIEFASDRLKMDVDVANAVLSIDGLMICYLDDSLKRDENIILKALSKNRSSYEYIPEDVKKDKKTILNIINAGGDIVEYLDEELKKDRDILECAVKKNPWNLLNFKKNLNEIKDSKEIIINAIKNDFDLMVGVDKIYQKDIDVITRVLSEGTGDPVVILHYAEESIKKDKTILEKAIVLNPYCVTYADKTLLQDNDFMHKSLIEMESVYNVKDLNATKVLKFFLQNEEFEEIFGKIYKEKIINFDFLEKNQDVLKVIKNEYESMVMNKIVNKKYENKKTKKLKF